MVDTPAKCEPPELAGTSVEVECGERYTEIEISYPDIKTECPEYLNTIGQSEDAHHVIKEAEEDTNKRIETSGGLENKKSNKITTKTYYVDKRSISEQNNGRKFVCSLCSSAFIRGSHLNRHLLTHTREKHFACDECSSIFNSKITLNRHKLTHSGVTPFACGQCSSTFKHKSHMERHILTHTGEKPFSCAQCSCVFSQKSSLKTHLLTHTGERPFSCLVCGSAYLTKSHLAKHLLTHGGDIPFS